MKELHQIPYGVAAIFGSFLILVAASLSIGRLAYLWWQPADQVFHIAWITTCWGFSFLFAAALLYGLIRFALELWVEK